MIDKRARLLQLGRELFSAKGFKDTSVTDITKKAGIATGSFYSFFKSKEELFMELFLEENVKLKEDIMDQVDLDDDPASVISQLMVLNEEGMRNNPILREWYNREVFEKVERKYREQKGLEQMTFLYESFNEAVKHWQEKGKMRKDISPEMIMALFTAIIVVETHKEEVGVDYFPDLVHHLVGFVLEGLRSD